MNHKLFCAIVIVFVELFSTVQLSHAIGRKFGCSGGCYTPAYAAPAVVRAPDNLQTFIFNNIQNPLSLDPRGDTVYGVSRALEYNSPSSSLYLDIARRSLEVASEMGGNARGVDAEILQAATIAEQGRAVEAAFRALKPDVTARSTSTTTRITLRNGIPVFEESQDVQPVPRGPIVGGNICLKCHAAGGPASEKFVIDDTYDLQKHMRAEAAIESGSMPPKSALTDLEKATIRLQLGKLVP